MGDSSSYLYSFMKKNMDTTCTSNHSSPHTVFHLDKLIFEPNNVTCVHDDMIFHCATDRYDDIVSVTWHIGEDVADDNLISCDGLQLKLPCNLTYDGARVRCTVKLRGGDVTSNNGTGWITVERTRLAPDNSKAMTCGE